MYLAGFSKGHLLHTQENYIKQVLQTLTLFIFLWDSMIAHIVPALDCPVQGLYAHTYMHLWVKNLSISKSCLSFIHVLLVLYCCDTCAFAMWLWACVCVPVLLLYCQNFCISYLAFCPACSISVCLYFPVNVRGECEGLCFTRPRASCLLLCFRLRLSSSVDSNPGTWILSNASKAPYKAWWFIRVFP